jgi:uncharacterized hydrophobic protein (TIGR00271 family)
VTTVLIASQPDEIRALVPWAQTIAQRAGHNLAIILPQRRTGECRLLVVSEDPSDDDGELVSICRDAISLCSQPVDEESDSSARANSFQIELYQLAGENWMSAIAGCVAQLKPKLLLVPAPLIARDQSDTDHWQTALLKDIECEVMLIQDDSRTYEREIRLAVILHDDFDNDVVLEHAVRLTCAGGAGSVTAIYVEPNIGDFAVSVGMKQLNGLLRRHLNRYEVEAFDRRVIVSGHLTDAVRQLDPEDYDFILTGASSLQILRRFFVARPSSDAPSMIPALAAVRPAQSFGNRIISRIDRLVQSVVPQLVRDQRVDLVSRIQTSSQWDFDFIFLVSLSALIACLGLAENSSAVIVGAMLVAPLMTPIAGVGLGVAHANPFLTKVALRTALRGFATAMLIGVLFGLCVRIVSSVGWLHPLLIDGDFPLEMENRTHPQFYDLLIALASGIAAAYAMSRPNLFSALPGVAIAAALVPPIATSGITLAHGDYARGGGALLLFVTNMVTIILGTSIVFRAVGIRSQKEGQLAAKWPRHSLLLLVVLSIVVTVMMELLQR